MSLDQSKAPSGPARIPDSFPAVALGFDGPCLIEVRPEWRSGRGRFWRPNAAGYTDDVGRAGIYKATERHESERSYFVDARVVLEAYIAHVACLTENIRLAVGAIAVSATGKERE